MLAVCTSYCIDFLQRHKKRQHAAVTTIQIYTDLEGCIQPIMESWMTANRKCPSAATRRQGGKERKK